MRAEDRVRLQHMIDAAEAAIRFVNGKQRADLDRDQMLLFALIRAVDVLGEASAKLSDDTRLLDKDSLGCDRFDEEPAYSRLLRYRR